jgi:hypothetical protein
MDEVQRGEVAIRGEWFFQVKANEGRWDFVSPYVRLWIRHKLFILGYLLVLRKANK